MIAILKKHSIFIGSMTTLMCVVGVFIFYQEQIIQEGNVAILATRPVDPRDLFRGEYVILRYEIERSEIISERLAGVPSGTDVYLKLKADDQGISRVVDASLNRPEADEEVWIRGIASGQSVRFASLEQYYVPEGAGTPIERLGDDIHVEVSIRNTEARVRQLLDGNLEPINPHDYIK
jgi:uncharacterized membrane-anchored protein